MQESKKKRINLLRYKLSIFSIIYCFLRINYFLVHTFFLDRENRKRR